MQTNQQFNSMQPQALRASHRQRFGADSQVFRAPGRVNIIGEHTDYTGGLILPAAIDFSTIAAISPRADEQAVIYSENFNKEVSLDLNNFPPQGSHQWSDYPFGVAWALREHGLPIPGFNLNIYGNVPLGSGLSSSASIEVATAFALLSLTQAQIPREQIALLCQRAENIYVGANCGIMDQFIACFGAQDHAVLVDTRSLAHSSVSIPSNVNLVICNSMVKHSHAGGEYNTRRAEVDEGSQVLRNTFASLPQTQDTLRDTTLAQLESVRSQLAENVFKRCRHIITENTRVLETVTALEAGDLPRVGQLLAEAHASYRDDFGASVPEVEALIEIASGQPGLVGARLTGGGFGGCTVNLVQASHAEAFRIAVHDAYRDQLGIEADIFDCRASEGAGRIVET